MKLTDRTSFAASLDNNDLIHIVDVDDVSQDPSGSSYKVTLGQLASFFTPATENLANTLLAGRAVDAASGRITSPNALNFLQLTNAQTNIHSSVAGVVNNIVSGASGFQFDSTANIFGNTYTSLIQTDYGTPQFLFEFDDIINQTTSKLTLGGTNTTLSYFNLTTGISSSIDHGPSGDITVTSTTLAGSSTVTVGSSVSMITSGLSLGIVSPDTSALLDLSTTTKGFLPPRMTAIQAEAISTPAEGLLVYSTNGTGVTIISKGWWGYDGATWIKLG